MFVQEFMTRDPITVRPESDPLAAIALLKACGFRHLPVVASGGTLVGIVDRTDLESFVALAGSPGVAKRQHRVEQAMTRDVISVPPDCPLEEAATLMVQHRIGSLPVVQAGRLVGIITETDIFRQLAAVLGGGSDALRLTVQVPDKPGQLAELTWRIASVGGNIPSVVAYPAAQRGRVNITLRVEGASRETVLDAISPLHGLEVLQA